MERDNKTKQRGLPSRKATPSTELDCADLHNALSFPPADFTTDEGRLALYHAWLQQRFAGGVMVRDKDASTQQRMHWLAHWLRTLVAQQKLDPHKRLPPYETIGVLFHLNTYAVAQVIQKLCDEQLFPQSAARTDVQPPHWTERDRFLWNYIGHMYALRFDHLQSLAARTPASESTDTLMSVSHTFEMLDRWEQNGIVVYKRIYYAQPEWICLTDKGLREVGLPFSFSATTPEWRTLEHLYWVTHVRMHLEDTCDASEMHWISGRSLRTGLWGNSGASRDGILVLRDDAGHEQNVDIKVQIRRPATIQVQTVLSEQQRAGTVDNPVRYYVNGQSRKTVLSVYEQMTHTQAAMRSSIDIIDVETWTSLLPLGNERV